MDDFYTARSKLIPPLPWPTFAPPFSLSTVRGEGLAQLGGIRGEQKEEARGLRPVVVSAGAGTPIAIEELPRSVSVLTPEQMEKESIANISDALNRLPGVTLVEGGPGTEGRVYSRGLTIDRVQIDGGAPRDISLLGNGELDLAPYERVELVRGANGGLVGAESYGGTINLVRKRPGSVPAINAQVTVGSYGRREAVADVSTPSLFDSTIAFRAVASYKRDEAPFPNYATDSKTLYAIADAPLGDAARLELGFLYSDNRRDGGNSGLFRDTKGNIIEDSRKKNYTPDFVYENSRTFQVFTKLYVDLAEDWNLQAGFEYEDKDTDGINAGFPSFIRPDGTLSVGEGLSVTEYIQSPRQFSFDARLTGRLNTFFLDHNLFFGVTRNERTEPLVQTFYKQAQIPITNFSQVDPWPQFTLPAFPGYSFFPDGQVTTSNVTVEDAISFRDLITATVSLGYSIRNDTRYGISTSNTSGEPTFLGLQNLGSYQGRTGGWLPRYQLAIKPISGLTLYGSLSSGFRQYDSTFDVNNQPLGPSDFANRELGLKFARQNWLFSASYYNNKETNLPTPITGRSDCLPSGSSQCFASGNDTTRTSKGFDLELAGELLPGLSTTIAYSHNKSILVSSSQPLQTLSPTDEIKGLIDWEPSFLNGTSFQLAGRYKSAVNNIAFLFDPLATPSFVEQPTNQPAHLVLDAGAEVPINDSFSVKLFVENITDKRYFSTIGTTTGNYYGRPRSVLATLRYKGRGTGILGQSSSTGLAPFGDPADWYAGAGGGMHVLNDFVGTADGALQSGDSPKWNFKTKESYGAYVTLGYRIDDHIRAELEASLLQARLGQIGASNGVPGGVCDATQASNGRQFDCSDSGGRIDQYGLMANLLYDFGRPDAAVRPYIGAGVGVVLNSVGFSGKMRGVGGSDDIADYCAFVFNGSCVFFNVPTEALIGADDQTVGFAAQARLGVTGRLSDRVELDVGYRLRYTPSLTIGTFNLETLVPRVGTFDAKLTDHALSLGIRWSFGGRSGDR